MNFHKTQCCAIQEITGLSVHRDPESAMISFCKQNIVNPPKFGSVLAAAGSIYSFYLFTQAHGGYVGNALYGQKFADFIREHKLGDVLESPEAVNAAFHPDHKNKVWIWTPDYKAVAAWWEAKTSKMKEAVAKRKATLVAAAAKGGE